LQYLTSVQHARVRQGMPQLDFSSQALAEAQADRRLLRRHERTILRIASEVAQGMAHVHSKVGAATVPLSSASRPFHWLTA
jgi:hypothetical protein